MLVGSANVAELARTAPTIDAFLAEPVHLNGVAWFSITAEMRSGAREAVLPPSLHPTVPPVLSMQAAQVAESSWGPFALAFVRVACRSGVRARGFTIGAVVSSEAACTALRTRFGFPARVGRVELRHGYAGVSLIVGVAASTWLAADALDPEPMGPDDVQYTGSLNLAHTPQGLRLVQVETEHHNRQVERVRARLGSFDAPAWGNRLLDPYFVVSSSLALGDVVLPAIRFVCRTDELAFSGTEAVNRSKI